MNRTEHLLTILAEEAAEVVQAACKCQRFGRDEVYEPIGKTNAERLLDELNDLYAIMEGLHSEGYFGKKTMLISPNKIGDKIEKVKKYMAYSEELGTLHQQHKPTEPR